MAKQVSRIQPQRLRKLLHRMIDIYSHSDANQIWAAGIKPILLCPGRLEEAHVPEESVSFQEVCRTAEIYLDILVAAESGRW